MGKETSVQVISISLKDLTDIACAGQLVIWYLTEWQAIRKY